MRRSLLLLGLLAAVALSGCSLLSHSDGSDEGLTDGVVLFSGTSFGECLGYCVTELTVRGMQAEIVYSGWNRDGAPEPVRHSRTLSAAERNALDRAFDRVAFQRADAVYGCPDCADGGAEWVGVAEGDEEERVTFEYGRSVREVAAFIEVMRDLRGSFPAPPRA